MEKEQGFQIKWSRDPNPQQSHGHDTCAEPLFPTTNNTLTTAPFSLSTAVHEDEPVYAHRTSISIASDPASSASAAATASSSSAAATTTHAPSPCSVAEQVVVVKEDPWSTLPSPSPEPKPLPYRLNRPLRPSTRARIRCDETRRQPGQVHSIVLLLNRTLSRRLNQTALHCLVLFCPARAARVRAGWLTFALALDLDLDLDTSDRHVRLPV